MTALSKHKKSAHLDSLERLFGELQKRAGSEAFVQKAVKSRIEDLNPRDSESTDEHGEVIGSLSDEDLIELLAEQIYLATLIEACEEKAEAAKRRYKTVKDRFKQVVCDRFDLPDDEPIIMDIENMKVLRGDRGARIEGIKGEVEKLFGADEDELMGIVKEEGEDTFKGDLGILLMGDRREDVVKLCNAIFEATEKDQAFLQKVSDDEDVPKPVRALADHVITERGLKCRIKRIIEWS